MCRRALLRAMDDPSPMEYNAFIIVKRAVGLHPKIGEPAMQHDVCMLVSSDVPRTSGVTSSIVRLGCSPCHPSIHPSILSIRLFHPVCPRPPSALAPPLPHRRFPVSPPPPPARCNCWPLLFYNGPRPAASRQSLVLCARDSARSLLGGGLSQKARDQKSHLARGGGGETGRRRWGRGGKVIL